MSQAIGIPAESHKITVAATIAISSFLLTPRLSRYRAKYPSNEIHVVISDEPNDLFADEVDIVLRYGDGNWPGFESTHLFDVQSFPVCTPEYLESAPALQRPADLVNHTLVNLDGVSHASEDWWWWLDEHDVRVPESLNLLGFNSYDNVIRLAMQGEGVALGFSGLVDDYVDDGRLVRPLGSIENQIKAVYVVLPAATSASPRVQKFIDWIIEETSAYKIGADQQAIPLH